MTDARHDLAQIAKAARRYLEREQAAQTGDLLADGATKAMKKSGHKRAHEPSNIANATAPGGSGGLRVESKPAGSQGPPEAVPNTAAATRATAPGGPGGLRGESKPAESQGPAEAGFVSARAGRMPAPSGRAVPPVHPEPASAPRAMTNLFGEEEPTAPQPTRRTTAVDDLPPPSIFEEGLNPGGLEPRAALAAESVAVLEPIAEQVRACTKCGLCDTRTQAVPGVGTAKSGIVFVGEAPGADEDRLGEPFVGRAGQLLDKIIKAMHDAQLIPGMPLDRSTVYIANVLKCRPPENRNPLPHEIESCSPYLRRQLEALKPRIICCLGKFAAELLVGAKGSVTAMRGKVYRYQGAKLIVTFHPAYCLRNPASKRPVWEDMQLLAREYLSD